MKLFWALSVAAAVGAAGLFLHAARAADRVPTADRLVVHEWGTFTSFSGSDGAPMSFEPNSNDLPAFVSRYPERPHDLPLKSQYMRLGGTVSMETPVLYFYAEKPLRATVQVDFPDGWMTEVYPEATAFRRGVIDKRTGRPRPGEGLRWDVKLLPGQSPALPREKGDSHYYQARATDAAPVEVELALPDAEREPRFRGATILEHEKFLFYRGVGVFAPPVTVQALGGGKVRVKNVTGGKATGLVLVTVEGERVQFRRLDDLAAGGEATAALPDAGTKADLAALMVKQLTAAGLYEKEAQAMVNTWEKSWFGEPGCRLLSIPPRTRTDALLPLAVSPTPTELVRVLVSRHDFLTPEQEAGTSRAVERWHAARAKMEEAEAEIQRVGRFAPQARALAEKQREVSARQ